MGIQILTLEQPIKVIDITKRKSDSFKFWIPTIIAFITTTILIKNEIKTIKVFGKVISKTYSEVGELNYRLPDSQLTQIKGQSFTLKLSLSCINKNLYYKQVKVWLSYGNERIEGKIYWSNFDSILFKNNLGPPSKKRMRLPANEFLTFNSVLQRDKVSMYYIKFIAPNKFGSKIYDKIHLEFIKPNGKSLKISVPEIEYEQFFFDESLFE